MMPSTRERTSTRRYGDTWPTNSYASRIVAGATVMMPTCAGGGTNAFAGALLQAVEHRSSTSANAMRRVGELGMQRQAEERRRMIGCVVLRSNVTDTAWREEERRAGRAASGRLFSPVPDGTGRFSDYRTALGSAGTAPQLRQLDAHLGRSSHVLHADPLV